MGSQREARIPRFPEQRQNWANQIDFHKPPDALRYSVVWVEKWVLYAKGLRKVVWLVNIYERRSAFSPSIRNLLKCAGEGRPWDGYSLVERGSCFHYLGSVFCTCPSAKETRKIRCLFGGLEGELIEMLRVSQRALISCLSIACPSFAFWFFIFPPRKARFSQRHCVLACGLLQKTQEIAITDFLLSKWVCRFPRYLVRNGRFSWILRGVWLL